MRGNVFGGKGSKAIAEMLQKNDALQVLDLSFCAIGFVRERGIKSKLLQQEQEAQFKKNLAERDGKGPRTEAERKQKERKVKEMK